LHLLKHTAIGLSVRSFNFDETKKDKTMNVKQILLKEMELEAATTRKMLAIVPDDKYDWKPHTKSMNMQTLATHIAELLGMVKNVITDDEIDFAKEPYNPTIVKNNAELMQFCEENLLICKQALNSADENAWEKDWVMRSGESIFISCSKHEAVRHTFCQVVHHRAQLGVYLRLLNIPIPGSYGPSTDEMGL
jgi:uncharacterized damage-inducible protein DinB